MNEPFQLQREPATRIKPARFESVKAKQATLFSGLDCLPGQADLFETDGQPEVVEAIDETDEPEPIIEGRRLKVEFSQAPVRPNPDRGLIWLSDCARYAVILGDRLQGTPMEELGLQPLYRGIWISPDGQRLIRRANGRAHRHSFEQAAADCRRHERKMRLNPPKRRRRMLKRR